jgi:antitoxin component of RelBE/YafQ-DinJ toxin-antitoxin module
MKQETIKIRISDDVKAKFQKLCAMQGKGMSKFLQRLIDFEVL